ncbi:uncharacterized protein LOC117100257 isoform X2 [Anneissia japonica]|uniref:uncharacterized protein LOC117100257 isoform X2 n=1 Tax=Anneissia japonica TaxID=1529436 RepID=UPI0014259F20|nr:uncharacterized protein LOC117100257 isoform X2 [Anneissia japonica]
METFPRPAPPPVGQEVDLNEFFSPELKDIYPGFDAVIRLDEYVAKTPETPGQTIRALVEHLMEITSSEYDKSRVIIRWVATNIAYDLNFLNTGSRPSSTAEDVLKKRSGICEGFSNLVLEMCRIAGLECEKICGIAKVFGYKFGDDLRSAKFRHAWNRIKISETWFLCDATMASGYIKRENRKYEYIFQWNEGYFLVPPETLRYSHKPDDEELDLKQWTLEARVFPSGCLYKMSILTTAGYIKTNSNKVDFQFQSMWKMDLWSTLIDDATGKHVENSVASFTNEKVTTLFVRLPRAGSYSVVIFGNPVNLSERSKKMIQDRLLRFNVHTTCVSGSQPFPKFTSLLGSLPAFTDGGFRSSVNFPIIETDDGYAKFTVYRPGGEPIRFKFRHSESLGQLNKYVFANAYPEKVVFNIRCPKKGEYSLILGARPNNDQVDDNEFPQVATYLILNKNEQGTPLPSYLSEERQWGPADNLSKLDILLNPKKGSEITCNKDETVFELSFNEEQIQLSYRIKAENDKVTSSWVCAETNRSRGTKYVKLSFRFRVPVSGFYEFKIFAGKIGAESNDLIGRWLLNVVNLYEGELFIGNENVPWGSIASKMTVNNLQVISPNRSTIYPNDEDSTLIIESELNKPTGLNFSLKDNSDTDLHECVLADSVIERNDEKMLYKFQFYPHEAGFYRFDVFSEFDHLGSWMIDQSVIDAHKSKQMELPSNDKRPWGPLKIFFDYGFSVVTPESSIISTSSGAECKLIISTDPRGKILGKLNFRNQADNLTDSFDSVTTSDGQIKKIVIKFKLSQKGYYKFSLFISNSVQDKFVYGGGWLIHCV